MLELRQHGAVGGDPGAGADQQIAGVLVFLVQAEPAVRAAALNLLAFIQRGEQGRGGAAGHEADRDFNGVVHPEGMVMLGRQRVAAFGRAAVRVVEMHLDELAGDEIKGLAVIAGEFEMAHARRQHAAAYQFQREMICHGDLGEKETLSTGGKPDILDA